MAIHPKPPKSLIICIEITFGSGDEEPIAESPSWLSLIRVNEHNTLLSSKTFHLEKGSYLPINSTGWFLNKTLTVERKSVQNFLLFYFQLPKRFVYLMLSAPENAGAICEHSQELWLRVDSYINHLSTHPSTLTLSSHVNNLLLSLQPYKGSCCYIKHRNYKRQLRNKFTTQSYMKCMSTNKWWRQGGSRACPSNTVYMGIHPEWDIFRTWKEIHKNMGRTW